MVKKTVRICATVYTQYRRVSDGQTDGRTDILHSPRYAYASRCNYIDDEKWAERLLIRMRK